MAKKKELVSKTDDALNQFIVQLHAEGRDTIQKAVKDHISEITSAAQRCKLVEVLDSSAERYKVLKMLDKQINVTTPYQMERATLMIAALEVFGNVDNEVVGILKDKCGCKEAEAKTSKAKTAKVAKEITALEAALK